MFSKQKKVSFLRKTSCFLPKSLRKNIFYFLKFSYDEAPTKGIPTRSGVTMCYWRKRDISYSNNPNPNTDKCGVLWFCPTIPFKSRDIIQATQIIEKYCLEFGFESNLGILCIKERTLDLTGAICYDRTIAGEDEKAIQCHDAIMDALINSGYPPYRLGIQSMKYLKNQDRKHQIFLRKIKKILDPNEILSRDRYILSGVLRN